MGLLFLLIAATFPTLAQEKKVQPAWTYEILRDELCDRFDISGTVTLTLDSEHPFKFLHSLTNSIEKFLGTLIHDLFEYLLN